MACYFPLTYDSVYPLGSILMAQNKLAHPLGVQAIIKGDVRTITHPVTGVVTQTGNGKYLYKISQRTNRPWFVLSYRQNG